MDEKPTYIVEVRRDWRYGPRARFWSIKKWDEDKQYWKSACRGGLSYTEFGMWRAINKKLKKMKFGYSTNYFTLDRKHINIDGPSY